MNLFWNRPSGGVGLDAAPLSGLRSDAFRIVRDEPRNRSAIAGDNDGFARLGSMDEFEVVLPGEGD